MQVAILSARPGWHSDRLCRAFLERGHVPHVSTYEGLRAHVGGAGERAALTTDGIDLFHCDAVLSRTIPHGSLEQIIYRVDALHWVERRGIPVVNPARAIERCVDKFYTSALLQQAGLPTPATVVCERAEEAMQAVRELGDVIIKPLFGSMGQGMVRVSDVDTGWRVVRALAQINAVFYVQRVVPHDGSDIRVMVVDGQGIGAIERRSPDGGWRTNVSRGGTTVQVDLSADREDLAVRAAAAVNATYAGVDLVVAPEGDVLVLEVNAIPGWEGFEQATGIDVGAAIAEAVERRVTDGLPMAAAKTS